MTIKAVNWNQISEELDRKTWEQLTHQFWLDTRFAISNDKPSWATLNTVERATTMRALGGLTLLDTLQSEVGVESLKADARNKQERAVLNNIEFMESVHAKSYSKIFSTLYSTEEIDELFRWTEECVTLQRKAEIVKRYYDGADPLKKKVASTMLESFLFYSGFYMPLYWSTRSKLTNTSDMVKFIIRDEGIHGYYIGAKYQLALQQESQTKRDEMQEWTIELLLELYENEIQYTQDLYDPIGRTEKVKKFLHYNADKAMQNLGYDALFNTPMSEQEPEIIAALQANSENGDFFSTTNSYMIGETEALSDDDFDF